MEPMTVADLIGILQKFPQEAYVAYQCCSEQVLLEEREIKVEDACLPRPDGWVQDKRPDMPTHVYVMFPGN